MSKLLITTQVLENYGVHSWDGVGEVPQYWKAKGGDEYFIENVDQCDMIDVIVDRARAEIECDTVSYREYVVGYRLVADDYMTEFERSQLEYDGKVSCPARRLEVA